MLDREVRDLRDQFVTRAWSKQLYNGMYFSPEREYVNACIIKAQEKVNGIVRMMAYKGNVCLPETFSREDRTLTTSPGLRSRAIKRLEYPVR